MMPNDLAFYKHKYSIWIVLLLSMFSILILFSYYKYEIVKFITQVVVKYSTLDQQFYNIGLLWP